MPTQASFVTLEELRELDRLHKEIPRYFEHLKKATTRTAMQDAVRKWMDTEQKIGDIRKKINDRKEPVT